MPRRELCRTSSGTTGCRAAAVPSDGARGVVRSRLGSSRHEPARPSAHGRGPRLTGTARQARLHGNRGPCRPAHRPPQAGLAARTTCAQSALRRRRRAPPPGVCSPAPDPAAARSAPAPSPRLPAPPAPSLALSGAARSPRRPASCSANGRFSVPLTASLPGTRSHAPLRPASPLRPPH